MNTPLIVAAATDNTTEEMKIKVLKLLPFFGGHGHSDRIDHRWVVEHPSLAEAA